VYLHTMVTDEKGEKMAKVKGNTIDPLDVVQKHGADALRFALAWLTTQAAQGKNIRFSWSNVEDARRFANKIWNATRFVLGNLADYDPDQFADRTAEGPDSVEFDLPERWILSRVQRATEEINTALEDYRFAEAAQAVYHFIWNEICDWYIELAKARLQDPEKANERWKIQGTLVTALDTAMRLLHPFMPFLTEELWQKLPKPQGAPQSIVITLYPIADLRYLDDASEASMALVQKVVTTVRALRTENNVPSSLRPGVVLNVTDDYKKTILDGYAALVSEQARLGALVVRRGGEPPQGGVLTAMAGDVEVLLTLPAKSDTGAERAKLVKDRDKLAADRDFLKKKLANPQFLEKAPPAVLEKDRGRLAEIEAALAKVEAALARL
ncbi:MAG: class I tRNA ligase family protein, partial [Deltaproteobacteria bacterium]|nr:class I tRNA ligase family protein [Deltaproteobacteria bacterium]